MDTVFMEDIKTTTTTVTTLRESKDTTTTTGTKEVRRGLAGSTTTSAVRVRRMDRKGRLLIYVVVVVRLFKPRELVHGRFTHETLFLSFPFGDSG